MSIDAAGNAIVAQTGSLLVLDANGAPWWHSSTTGNLGGYTAVTLTGSGDIVGGGATQIDLFAADGTPRDQRSIYSSPLAGLRSLAPTPDGGFAAIGLPPSSTGDDVHSYLAVVAP